jgi:phosphohistidine phosphatase
MMVLYVMRHGEAETRAESPEKSDVSRRITSEGTNQVRRACELAKMLGAKPDLFISSPLVRAKQSAEIAKQVLNPTAELRIDNCLEPEADVDDAYAVLSKLKGMESAMLVTHLPLLGLLIRDLLDWHVERKNLDMDPGSIMRIDSKKTRPKSKSGDLVWLIPQIQTLSS